MAYLVIAYPKLAENDLRRIQDYRRQHDTLYYSVVAPHFTIVFPVGDQTKDNFLREIKERSKDVSKFDFTLKCATINKDAFNDYYHVFLVPDHGYSSLVKLHDRLYGGLLFGNLRLDLDYIPHIGVGNSKDKMQIKRMTDEWNSHDFSIDGQVEVLTIIDFTNNKISLVGEIELKDKRKL